MTSPSKASLFRHVAVALAAALAISGCSESPSSGSDGQTVAGPVAAPVGPQMNEPLTQLQVGAEYALVAEPVLVQNGEFVRAVVKVKNSGTVAINSTGKYPVNFAISVADGAGKVILLDFVRVALPAAGIPAGGTVELVAQVPVKAVVGNSMRFGLVQEGVAWYSDLNVTPLDYGPLTSCEDQGRQAICGKDGKPLQTHEST